MVTESSGGHHRSEPSDPRSGELHAIAAPATLFVDGGCGFCIWSGSAIQRRTAPGTLRIATIHSLDGARALGHLTEQQRQGSFHLETAEGRLLSAGAAVGPLLRLVPGGRPAAALAIAAPVTTDRLYRAFARRRGWWARVVPDRWMTAARSRLDRQPVESATPTATKAEPRPGAELGDTQ